MGLPGLFSGSDTERPSETPEVFANANTKDELHEIGNFGIDSGSFLKFAEFSGKLDSLRSEYCPHYETIAVQVTPGTITRDDTRNHSTCFGEFSIHGGDTPWHWTSDREITFQHFYLSKALLAEMYRERSGHRFDDDTLPLLTGASDPGFVKLLGLAAAEFGKPSALSMIEMDAWAMLIGEQLLKRVSEDRTCDQMMRHKPGFTREIRIATDWIEANLDQQISIKSLSQVTGVAATSLQRAMRDATGLPPHQYVTARRIERARELLCGDDLSIAQIAYKTGFSSQAHLTDVFRRKVGTTPGQFRKDMRT